MAVRSFEEQVMAELGALRFTPEEQVWLNVEAALQKEKKRRWLIWIFAGVLAGSALGLYYHYKPFNTPMGSLVPAAMQTSAPIVSNKQDTTNHKEQKNNTVEQQPASQVSTSERVVEKKRTGRTGFSEPGQNSNENEGKMIAGSGSKIQGSTTGDHTSISGQNIAQQKPNAVDNGHIAQQVTTSAPMATTTITAPIVPSAPKNADPVQQTDSSVSVMPDTKEPASQADTSAGSPSLGSMVTPTLKHPWRLFGIVDLGSSSDVLPPSFSKSGLMDAAPLTNLPGNAFPGTSNNTAYSNGALYKDPTRSAGLSFGLGVQATKQIGKHSEIGLGIAYQRYQTGITVGRKMQDSVILYSGNNTPGYYYQSTDSVRYANNWHFAEFTFDYYQRINMGGSTVMRWRLGLGAAVLLASNALYFDQSSKSLYEKSAWRNQVQFNLSTGFDLLFGKKQDIYLGPQLTYFLTPSSDGSNYRFLRAALRAGFVIPKRKK